MVYLKWGIKDIEKICRSWMGNKFDGLIVIDGNRGLGKSTLGMKLALRFEQFKPRHDIVFARGDVIRHIAEKKFGVTLADEMINVTYNRDFYSEDQKKLLKMLNMYRDSCNLLIACVPNFFDLDKQYRALCKMRLNVVRRGLAIIHTKNQTSYSEDAWDKKTNEKIEQKWIRNNVFKPRYNQLTTFKGLLPFGDLGLKQRELYEDIKAEKRHHLYQEEMEANKKPEDEFYSRVLKQVQAKELNPEKLQVICDAVGKTYRCVSAKITSMLGDLNLPPTSHWIGSRKPKKKIYNIPLGISPKNVSETRRVDKI